MSDLVAVQKMKKNKDIELKLILRKLTIELISTNLINTSTGFQVCPLCNHMEKPTLSKERIDEIISELVETRDLSSKELELENRMEMLIDGFDVVFKICKSFLPRFSLDSDALENLKNSNYKLGEIAKSLSNSYSNINEILVQIELDYSELKNVINELDIDNISKLEGLVQSLCQRYINFLVEAAIYWRFFSNLEQIFGLTLEEDYDYKKMRNWLDCFENIALLKIELNWELSKKLAHQELKSVREKLIEYRQNILESKRSAFNEEISAIWNTLRGDRYSKFQSLYIPKSKGRGFPVEINVMAVLDDGNEEKEVDALRIFSESQINALGISAFITRSKILGHKFIIFDDPVQSMDEEHFKTFASGILRKLLDDNFQVIIFTHSDLFAREISYNYWYFNDYSTMHVRHLRKKGCQVEEGNRQVSERLKMAIRLSDEGNFSEAWKYIRLAIERMYLIINLKYTPKFDPSQWEGQTADYMWKQGTGQIIDTHKPEMKQRLKSILTMSASGTHDKLPYGGTDIVNAVRDINSLLYSLQISD